jgi:multiple sugar transport system permease protein
MTMSGSVELEIGSPARGPGVREALGAEKHRSSRIASGGVILIGLAFFWPMLWLVLAAFDSNATWAIKLPHFSLHNFVEAVQGGNGQAVLNSVELSLVATVVSVVPAIFGGYALSRRRIAGRHVFLVSVLFMTAVPIGIVVIPLYEAFSDFGLLSLFPTAVFVGVTNLPFALWLVVTGMDSVPIELEEAAFIERASTFQTIMRVMIPSARPAVIAATFFSFTWAWGAFLVPLVLISSPSQLVGPLALYDFIHAAVINYGGIAAFSIVFSLPVIVLYLGISRRMAGGFAFGGAIKG